MRAAIDPLAFYRRNDRSVLPIVGRVVDAPQDFYSSRMTKKERKRTMLDELLSDQRLTQSKREK
ncbi:Fcf2 pre-rRNA processing [Cooperia oncophora]